MSLSNYDYSKYPTWEQVKTPSGATYYVVPGTAFVYDPFLSQQKGKPVLWQNPKPQQDERAKAEKAAKDAASPLNQLLPVAGSTAGVIGAKYAVDALGPASAAEKLAEAELAKQTALQAPEIVSATTAGTEAAGAGVGAEAAGAGAGTAGAGSGFIGYGPLAGIAAGTYLAGKAAYDQLMDKQDNSAQGKFGRGQLAWSTGGLSEVARAFGLNLGHKSTKQVQQEHTKQLADTAPEDTAWLNYLGGMRNQEVNKETPFAGKYKTFDEYKEAGLQADDLTGVYGNLKTFGPEWAKLNFNQQKQVTQGLIDAGLYNSKKGEVVITDEDKAHEIKNQVLGVPKPTTTADAFTQGMKKQSLIGKPIVLGTKK